MSALPEQWHARAIASERSGDRTEGIRLLAQALAEHPDHAQLQNALGSMAMRSGDAESAQAAFSRALKLEPDNLEFALNLAIALGQLELHEEALSLLHEHEAAGARQARYWSVRATTARAAGRPAEAAAYYDKCLSIEPRHVRALHGRARTALDRGEKNAAHRFDAALAVNGGEADLWLGKAQALDAQGDSAAARDLMQQLVAQAPGWLDGLKFLSQLRLADGEKDFASPYFEAARRVPDDPSIPLGHAAVLAGLEFADEAADVAAEARKRFPDNPQFRLLEAVHAGDAGQIERAESIYAELALDTSERAIHEARHRIRRGQFERAEGLLAHALDEQAMVHTAYALLGFIWRINNDPRAAWLHEQEGLVRLLPLRQSETILPQATKVLHDLHETSPLPLGQSLRGGTQTRHILFHRREPELAQLRDAIQATLEDYRAGLPGADDAHPLLRHRLVPWTLAGSWSVRMQGGGDYHASHIHPLGMLSSALYLLVPEEAEGDDRQGWLEIGRPPPDLGLDLGPLASIQPQEGHLALFPSTLYHGTTSFREGLRMTVAFDVVPAIGRRHG
ncbi:MAG: tetratricopeptide repeat protein [Erythrobacter sp.]|uniref:2OG-Fe(II) oxygenase family protein n=1 Tax=Erythrobacter sp. TaxID=1042 RepID=UPI001B0E7104|nr:tetratricopeptide repeat protein [Erythrobacter sp.]MBO6769374.1 tetratricopeptide repeat protein [Erythrobacter sp.]